MTCPYNGLNGGKKRGGFGGEVCTDEAKSTRNWPPHAGGLRNPVLFGLENGSSLPSTACAAICGADVGSHLGNRSEEHTSELQSLMRISYAVFCLKKKKKSQ